MSAMVFDVIRRYLEYAGYEVKHAQNFTDIDDKIINRANAEERTRTRWRRVHQSVAGPDRRPECQARDRLPTRDAGTRATSTRLTQTLIDKGKPTRWRRCLLPLPLLPRLRQALTSLSGRHARGEGSRWTDPQRRPNGLCPLEGVKAGEPAWDSPWGGAGPAGTSSAPR